MHDAVVQQIAHRVARQNISAPVHHSDVSGLALVPEEHAQQQVEDWMCRDPGHVWEVMKRHCWSTVHFLSL